VANYRKAFTPSNAKDDPSDALIQVEILTLRILMKMITHSHRS
jgi:hypothetical protein